MMMTDRHLWCGELVNDDVADGLIATACLTSPRHVTVTYDNTKVEAITKRWSKAMAKLAESKEVTDLYCPIRHPVWDDTKLQPVDGVCANSSSSAPRPKCVPARSRGAAAAITRLANIQLKADATKPAAKVAGALATRIKAKRTAAKVKRAAAKVTAGKGKGKGAAAKPTGPALKAKGGVSKVKGAAAKAARAAATAAAKAEAIAIAKLERAAAQATAKAERAAAKAKAEAQRAAAAAEAAAEAERAAARAKAKRTAAAM